MALRNLILVLGDQLNADAAAFDDFDATQDAVWMSETAREIDHVWSHKIRITLFLSAMRHFRDRLRQRGIAVHYHQLTADRKKDRGASFGAILAADVPKLRPDRIVLVQPGDYRVQQELRATAQRLGVELTLSPDRSFYCSLDDFTRYAAGRKRMVLENFYRWLRRRERILVDEQGEPEGGQWNFDRENRASFGRAGPPGNPGSYSCKPDALTREVVMLVQQRFADHPGRLDLFDLPVTPEQAHGALDAFVRDRLANFGAHQDAMWGGAPFLYHSRLSAALNLKLLAPRTVVDAAVRAYRRGKAPLNSVEGFVRQILGWREFVHGLYWLDMPGYRERNVLAAQLEVPACFWDGATDMECLRQSTRALIDHSYTHHIQRLMVLGNFALLAGVDPGKFHEWHMAMYADAIDWVSLPNALGMSQHGDGGRIGTKPYCASGNYIKRMSNYCKHCRYDPGKAIGDDACPFTTLYWDFLKRHTERFRANPRMSMPYQNLARKSAAQMRQITERAARLRQSLCAAPPWENEPIDDKGRLV